MRECPARFGKGIDDPFRDGFRVRRPAPRLKGSPEGRRVRHTAPTGQAGREGNEREAKEVHHTDGGR